MENNGKKVLVTGGTGAVGPVLVRQLLEDGYQVRLFARQTSDLSSLPLDQIEVVRGDITQHKLVWEAAEEQEIILHLAALLHINQPTGNLHPRYYAVNVDGTRNVLDAARIAGTKQIILFSTISVYGETDHQYLATEDAPLNGDSFYAKTKAEADQIGLRVGAGPEGPAVTVLRLASVYGPTMKGNYIRLLGALKRGIYCQVGSGDNRRTLVHAEDVARAALAVLDTPSDLVAGKIYNVTDEGPHTMSEIIDAMCQALDSPQPRIKIPESPLRFALKRAEQAQRLLGRTPKIGTFTLDKLLEDVAVDGSRLRNEVGFTPRYSLLDGWRQTVEQMAVA